MSEWTRIPERYRVPVEEGTGGSLEELTYTFEGLKRRALVRLPRAYREEPDRRFPVCFLMHGGGGSEDEFFGGLEKKSPLAHMLDRMTEEGVIRPLIVVTPTFYRPAEGNDPAKTHAGDAMALTETYWRELNGALIPAVDAAFRTEADRNSRAFGGFSMGAEATWSVLCRGGTSVRYYIPMSGDFWAVSVKGGKDHTAETCDRLIEGIRENGLTAADYEIFAATGTEDIAYEAMKPMVEELLTRAPWFSDGDCGGNLIWKVSPGWHAYEWCWDYLMLALTRFFPADADAER